MERCLVSPLSSVFQAIGKMKDRQRKATPEITSEKDERMTILVKFCMRKSGNRGKLEWKAP